MLSNSLVEKGLCNFDLKSWAERFFDPMLITMAAIDTEFQNNSTEAMFAGRQADSNDMHTFLAMQKLRDNMPTITSPVLNPMFSIAKDRGNLYALKATDEYYALVSVISKQPGTAVMYVCATCSLMESQPDVTVDASWLQNKIITARSFFHHANMEHLKLEDVCPLLPRNHLQSMWEDQKMGSVNVLDHLYVR